MAKNNNLKDFLVDIANAIREKTGDVGLINPQDFSKKITTIKATPVAKKDVNFYDYDGAVLYAYGKNEFLALEEMPELPTQKGLICQGWNYDFKDAIDFVKNHGVIDIGATYITDDGKTRLYIKISEKYRMDVPLCFGQTIPHGVIIDWGDGSETETFNKIDVQTTHKYMDVGDYIITLSAVDGCELTLGNVSNKCVIEGLSVYKNMLQKVELGSGITTLYYSFTNCNSLTSVTIPNNITNIDYYAFGKCHALTSLVIPQNVTNIGNYAFTGCYSLVSIIMSPNLTSIGKASFEDCHALKSIILPEKVITIDDRAFYFCFTLATLILPENVTTIGEYAFYWCYALKSITIPKSITIIDTAVFQYCITLKSVVIPNNVTIIGVGAFVNCSGVAFYDFSSHTTIPNIGTKSFTGIASDCKIVVPDGLYDEWWRNSTWNNYAKHLIRKSDWDAQQK